MPNSRAVTLVANTLTVVTLPADDAINFLEVVSDGAAAVSFRTGGFVSPVAVGTVTFTDVDDTWHLVGHGLLNDNRVNFSAKGVNPTTYDLVTSYYVVAATADTFQLSATKGGAAVVGAGLDSDGTWSADHVFVVVGGDDQWTLPATVNARRVIKAWGYGITRDVGLISSGTPTVTVTGMELELAALMV